MSTESSSAETRVVVTGLGIVSPIGCDLETLWNNLQSGTSGIAPLDSLPTAPLPFRSGGESKQFTGSIEDYGPLEKTLQRSIKKNMKVMCREIEMGVAAAQKALSHSGLGQDRDPDRCGCLFGCDYILTRPEEYADGIRNCRAQAGEFRPDDWPLHGLPKVGPLWLLKYLPNMPNSHVSIYNDFRGPNNSLTVREASMNLAIGEATSIIQRGAADVMIVGAAGTRIHPLRTAHVALIDNLASERDDPAEMARPFDASCDGMVLGEGAGAIVLESWEHAQRRGAKLWGEILGYGSAMVGPSKDGQRDYIRQAVGGALRSAIRSTAGRLPERWHLHAHGLSTPEQDRSEALAIADTLQDFDSIPVTSAKSYFGNLGAGAAAIELASSLLAIENDSLFPIRNLNTPADYATWKAAEAGMPAGRAVVHSSFTLQGQASSIVVSAA